MSSWVLVNPLLCASLINMEEELHLVVEKYDLPCATFKIVMIISGGVNP